MALIGLQLIATVFLFAKYVGSMDKLDADCEHPSLYMCVPVSFAFSSESNFLVSVRASSIDMGSSFYFGVVCTNGVLGVPVFMMVAHLVGFHIYLGTTADSRFVLLGSHG